MRSTILTIIGVPAVVVVAMTSPVIAETHDMAVRPDQTCAQIPVEPMEEADKESADYSAGLVFREHDLDGNGRPDFMTARQIDAMNQALPDALTGDTVAMPLFYWVDLNSDATYDQGWIDRGGLGRCEDIALHQGPAQGRALLPLYAEHVTR